MNEDDDLCLCFHVSRRKVVQFIRANNPSRPSQLSECYGAGTGCGWCRPFLKRLLEDANPEDTQLPSPEDYAAQRAEFRSNKT